MPVVCLVTVDALDLGTGNRVTIYAASANDRRVTGLNGVVWEPAITQVPSLSINLWNGDFQAAPEPGNAVFALNMEVIKRTFAGADQYAWIGSPVKVYAEEIGTAWPWTQRFQGRVSSINRKGQSLSITAKVETETFAKNILTATYAGTGGIEGGADIKGRVKPLVIGWAQNVEPVLIDAVNSVYQFSAYGAIEAVSALYERASDFGASVGDYANYTALVAASIPAGRWGSCLASGLVRLGAPAYGAITGDIRGHRVGGTTPRLTGAVINALATVAGVSAGNLNTASLSALDSAVPYNVNVVVSDQTKFIDLAGDMALACNYQAAISLLGQFFVASINLGASPAFTLNAQGRASPQVINPPDELEVSVPYWKVILGANRSWKEHSLEEIALTAPWVELGIYSGATTYREGNVVSLSDGSRYVYINAMASAGNSPPNATYWASLSGSPTVAGIIGQTAWATYTGFTPAQVTSPGANLLFNSSFNIGALGWSVNTWTGPFKAGGDVGAWFMSTSANNDFLYNYDVTKTPVFPNSLYTLQLYAAANGTSAGSNRPYMYIDWHNAAGSYITSSPATTITVNSGYNTFSITATSPATAAYGRAVINSNQIATGGGAIYISKWKLELGGSRTPWSDEATNGALYQSGQTIDSLKPGEINANNTESRTAAAVVGQSAWATYASLTPAQVAQIVPNMVYNPTGVLGMDRWVVNSGSVTGNKGAGSEGYYFYTSSGSNAAPVNFYQDIPIAAVSVYTISADIFAQGISVSSGAAQCRVYIQWLNGAGAHLSYSAVPFISPGTAWTHVSATGQVAPATAVTARVWCDVWGTGVYTITSVAWSKVKLQQSSIDTIFTDDASYGARYQSGVSIEALKPAQANADVTASNTAAAIIGQGTGATASTLAGLDPTAAALLTAAAASASKVAMSGSVISLFVNAGASVVFDGQVSTNAGGTSGTLKCQLQSSVGGANSFSSFATGSGVSVSSSEPGLDTASGTFTNSTGVAQVFDFRVNPLRTPGTAGGTVIASQSFIST